MSNKGDTMIESIDFTGLEAAIDRTIAENRVMRSALDAIAKCGEQASAAIARDAIAAVTSPAPLPEPPVDEDDEGDEMGVRERDDRFAQE